MNRRRYTLVFTKNAILYMPRTMKFLGIGSFALVIIIKMVLQGIPANSDWAVRGGELAFELSMGIATAWMFWFLNIHVPEWKAAEDALERVVPDVEALAEQMTDLIYHLKNHYKTRTSKPELDGIVGDSEKLLTWDDSRSRYDKYLSIVPSDVFPLTVVDGSITTKWTWIKRISTTFDYCQRIHSRIGQHVTWLSPEIQTAYYQIDFSKALETSRFIFEQQEIALDILPLGKNLEQLVDLTKKLLEQTDTALEEFPYLRTLRKAKIDDLYLGLMS